MTNKMVQITVEILDILAIATKEMQQSRASEVDLRFRFHDADIVPEKFVKRVIGRTDLEDGMMKLDKLTNEELLMASAQLLKVTYNIDNNMLDVKRGVQLVGDDIKAVDGKLQTTADGKQRLFVKSPASSLILII